jgi:protein-S-isoprenylcysteine O-methyltransferase Ste14
LVIAHDGDTIGCMITGILILACWMALRVYWGVSARSIKSAAEEQSPAARLARMPLWLGFLLFAVAWVYPFGPVAIHRTVFSDAVGVAICALGLFVAIWSRKALGSEWSQDVELKQSHELVKSGPYRLMRHPIYTGHLLMGVGTALASGLLVAFAGLAAFLAGFWIKLNQEERLLLRGFPEEYPAYKDRVKALIPYVF